MSKSDNSNDSEPAYTVLARKYRPSDFDQLIGQKAMVQTLANAFSLGRIAQGFMLTGVRGVGKTTTARILARALNYEGEGVEGPTIHMPQMGPHCEAIMQSRHVDVLEMDAASHTGIDDIREIIESTRYKPLSARYKVYIIDEVHMLSKSAFNALLKTLEEPPEHVKFIFATTEVQKVPVTVLSRCQRFDLKRVEMEELVKHFATIAGKEGAKINEEALALIAQASEGSVRDGLSILDQAIAHGKDEISGDDVRSMLGLADRMRIFDLLESVLKGDAASAIGQCEALFTDGADPVRILVDLSETVHMLTRKKIVDDRGARALSESERGRVGEMAQKLSMPVLSRCWQMLLKGIDECSRAPSQMAAVEMVLVRIAYAADLPSPKELARAISDAAGDSGATGDSHSGSPSAGTGRESAGQGGNNPQLVQSENQGRSQNQGHAPASRQDTKTVAGDRGQVSMGGAAALPKSADAFCEPARDPISGFEDIADLVGREGGLVLKIAFEENVRPVHFAPGNIEIALTSEAPRGLANDIKRLLQKVTGTNWMVAVSSTSGGETLAEQKQRRQQDELQAVSAHPLVKAALKQLDGARIADVRQIKSQQVPQGGADKNEES